VVAEEVRKLAEQSQEATRKITELIGQIQVDTAEAVSSMQAGSDQVKIGMEVVGKAGHAFENISKLVNEIAGKIKEVSASTQKVSTGSQKVVNSIVHVDSVSQEVSVRSQNILASVEEQSAVMQEIATSSEGLSKIAEGLQQEVLKFKL
jgi:methyl-accepting chemotaxis protein